MSDVWCFTSASFSYLDRVRTLRETIKTFHPEWKFCLCLCDKEPEGFKFKPDEEHIDQLMRVEDLEIPQVSQWIFEHDLVELCTAVKGHILCRLLEGGARKVFYIDPDIALFANLNEVETLLDSYDIVVTPHQAQPDAEKQAIEDNEIGSLKWGIFNLGFLAVANTTEGMRFATWWRDRLLEYCIDDVPNGLFTDQRWCDHVPVFFQNTFILRNPGYNVASWNLSKRPIAVDESGCILADGELLRFFHFTKINSEGDVMLRRYANGLEVFELMKWYRSRLEANRPVGLPNNWWAYRTYQDGTLIRLSDRRKFREYRKDKQVLINPFSASQLRLFLGKGAVQAAIKFAKTAIRSVRTRARLS